MLVIILWASWLGCVTAVETVISGDVYIDGILSIYKHEKNTCTSEIDAVSVEHYEAIKWTINRLNGDGSYIPGLTIGLRVHVTCGLPTSALDVAYNISRDMANTLAIIGPETSLEVEVTSKLFSSLPESVRPLQLGFAATAGYLSDKSVYKNFFRVNPPDDVEFKVVNEFMRSLNWTYMMLIHEDGNYGNAAENALTTYTNEQGFTTCFPEIHPVATTLSESEVQTFLIDVLRQLQNRRVKLEGVLVFGGLRLSRTMIEAIKTVTSESDYEKPVFLFTGGNLLSHEITDSYTNVTQGFYLSGPPKESVNEFETHWNKLLSENEHDIYLQKVINSSERCNNSLRDCSSYNHQSTFVKYAIQATLVTMEAIQKISSRNCSNSANCGDVLREMPKTNFINAMKDVSVYFGDKLKLPQFQQRDRISFPDGKADASITDEMFNVYNQRHCIRDENTFCYEKVFSYWQLNDRFVSNFENIRDYFGSTKIFPNIRKPQCPAGEVCTDCPVSKLADIEIKEGDMYIVGIVPIHGKSDTPLKCGKIKSGGFDVAESIKFEIEREMKDLKDSIPNASIGYIIIDSCNDRQIIQNRILQLHNKGVLINGTLHEVKSKILAYVGGWVSDISLTVAETLTRFGYVQVAYASTSPLLSDRTKYPYFMRVVQSDVQQGIEMLKVVNQSGSNLVQILYSKSSYGIGGKDSIVQYASKYGVCIANIVGVDQVENVNIQEVISNLTQPNSAQIVMVFLSSFDVTVLIEELNDKMPGYVFIASEAWGNRDIISKLPNLQGSITLANELPIDDRFKTYFKQLSPKNSKSPWLQKYMEFYFKCYFQWSFNKSSGHRQCSTADKFNPCLGPGCFKIETWVPFASVVVEAVLKGSKTTLLELCNTSSSICPEFRNNPLRLTENIASLYLPYDKISPKEVFNSKNDGVISYNKYLISKDKTGKAVYSKFPRDWYWNGSSCTNLNNDACNRCFSNKVPPKHTPEDKEKPEFVTMFVFIGTTVVLIIAIVIITICLRRKNGLCFQSAAAADTNTNDGGYIHAQYVIHDGYMNAYPKTDDADTEPGPSECSKHDAVKYVRDVSTPEQVSSSSYQSENKCSSESYIHPRGTGQEEDMPAECLTSPEIRYVPEGTHSVDDIQPKTKALSTDHLPTQGPAWKQYAD